jgi:Tfp pilus assembly ATPase PilU
MCTFDQSLLGLFEAGAITADEALCYAESPNNLRLAMNSLQRKDSLPTSFGLGKEDKFYP